MKKLFLLTSVIFVAVIGVIYAGEEIDRDLDTVVTGKIECAVFHNVSQEKCSTYINGPLGCGELVKEVRFAEDIKAPKSCLENHWSCEGGPTNYSEQKQFKVGGMTFTMNYDDQMDFRLAIKNEELEVSSEDSRRLDHAIKGEYVTAAQKLSLHNDHYWFVCNTEHFRQQ